MNDISIKLHIKVSIGYSSKNRNICTRRLFETFPFGVKHLVLFFLVQ